MIVEHRTFCARLYVCVHQTKPALSKPTIAAVSAFIAHGTNYAKCGDADKTTYYNYKQKKCLVSSMHSLAVGGFTGVLVSFSCAHIGAAPATLATWKGRSTSDVLVLMHVDGVENACQASGFVRKPNPHCLTDFVVLSNCHTRHARGCIRVPTMLRAFVPTQKYSPCAGFMYKGMCFRYSFVRPGQNSDNIPQGCSQYQPAANFQKTDYMQFCLDAGKRMTGNLPRICTARFGTVS